MPSQVLTNPECVRQIDGLEDLKARDPAHAWLWDVRLKVVKYICSRYGPAAVHSPEQLTYTEPMRLSTFRTSAYPGLRSASQLREILSDLHAVKELQEN